MEEFHRVMDVNVIGTFNVLRRACHVMADNSPDANGQRGVIVNTSSIAAYEGQIGLFEFEWIDHHSFRFRSSRLFSSEWCSCKYEYHIGS